MTVRLRLALTVLLTGLATALGVLVTMALAFERFEREAAYARADAFLGRVVAEQADLPAQQRRDPQGFVGFLKSLVLFEPASQLYLLAADGTVLASTGSKPLPEGFRVAIAPVREAAAAATAAAAAAAASGPTSAAARPGRSAAYVMGDDPEYMEDDAVIAARALVQPSIHAGAGPAGYLYLVSRKPGLPASRLARLGEQLAGPALAPVLAVVLLATALAAWIIAAVTRPLAVLSAEVDRAARTGFDEAAPAASPALAAFAPAAARTGGDDEISRLHRGFQALLARLHAQWDRLRRLDAFRRESVSNLSHDLRSPLTAAAASLETLQQRWRGAATAAEDLRLLDVALRNTHNAARLVRSLGDLAVLDEASFRLRLAQLDLAEMLDDIVMRFAERAARQGVALACDIDAAGGAGAAAVSPPPAPPQLVAEVDVELLERALANLIDNALTHTPSGGRITLSARAVAAPAAGVQLTVSDTGAGIATADLEHLFDRHFRGSAAGAAARDRARTDGGKGLGLAIVQRIVELHGGRVAVASEPGRGTAVTLELPLRRG
ncbi:MAG: HAMP domain-containing histidine kinase [Rubrivivax sp.]|nr:HAMP domain-containing histidine kinase [Rubrivivax sp.]